MPRDTLKIFVLIILLLSLPSISAAIPQILEAPVDLYFDQEGNENYLWETSYYEKMNSRSPEESVYYSLECESVEDVAKTDSFWAILTDAGFYSEELKQNFNISSLYILDSDFDRVITAEDSGFQYLVAGEDETFYGGSRDGELYALNKKLEKEEVLKNQWLYGSDLLITQQRRIYTLGDELVVQNITSGKVHIRENASDLGLKDRKITWERAESSERYKVAYPSDWRRKISSELGPCPSYSATDRVNVGDETYWISDYMGWRKSSKGSTKLQIPSKTSNIAHNGTHFFLSGDYSGVYIAKDFSGTSQSFQKILSEEIPPQTNELYFHKNSIYYLTDRSVNTLEETEKRVAGVPSSITYHDDKWHLLVEKEEKVSGVEYDEDFSSKIKSETVYNPTSNVEVLRLLGETLDILISLWGAILQG